MSLRKHLPTVLIAMVVAAVTAGGPAIAHGVQHALFAHNAGKVDGKNAVSSDVSLAARRGKLVATNKNTGRLPNNIILKATNADRIDGIDSRNLSRLGGRAFSDTFTESSPMSLAVPGYGNFVLFCDDNNTPGTPGDDLVTYGYGQELGAGSLNGMRATFAAFPTVDAETTLFNSDATNTFSTIAKSDDRVQVDQYLRSASGDKVIRVSAWAWEDSTSTTECIGVIEAQILR
jgi:hypothetical protein